MITLPNEINQGANWDGVSQDPNTGSTVSNRDSKMKFAEHQRIVFNAGGLLQSLPDDEVAENDNKARKALRLLRDLFHGGQDGVLYISKGIHQPYSNPHMQLSATIDGSERLYHLDVSAEDIVIDNNRNERFHWKGVRFSARIMKDDAFVAAEKYDLAWWPLDVHVNKKSRNSRNSISPPGLLALNQKIDEEIATRKAQSDEQKRRNRVLEIIKQKLQLSPKPGAGLHGFWEGKPAPFVTTKNNQEMCTYDGKHFCRGNGGKTAI